MISEHSNETLQQRSLRIWPGVAIIILQWLLWFIVPLIFPEAFMIGVVGVGVGGFAIVIWWAFFSRTHWLERVGAIVLMVVGVMGTPLILHESVAESGMGVTFIVYSLPLLCFAFVAWALLTRRKSNNVRRTSMVATILIACVAWSLVRTTGVTGVMTNEFHWRWAKTAEERMLDQAAEEPMVFHSVQSSELTAVDWPGFRGAGRDGKIYGTQIGTDWSQSPPAKIWQRPVGPAWSSFAVGGDFIYTQEQRGNNEVVSCYSLTTGEPVWMHNDAERFWEAMAGAGPRATPALHEGRLYALGATGILNALDASDGASIWSRNVSVDTGIGIPMWGFSGSPLIVDDIVVVAAEGDLAAYDIATGEPRWYGPNGGHGYSSPHLVTIDGVQQILLIRGIEAISVSPTNGKLLWKYEMPGNGSILQPALTAEGDLLISDGDRKGMRSISVTRKAGDWIIEDRWTTKRLKPYFSDFVVHKGAAFGFESGVLACIATEDGSRNWKAGRFGAGQLILLADQDMLVVLSEWGDLALVEASSSQFTERARLPVIEGKTWNHPVLVNDILLIRNDQEMVAFRLSLTGG